MEQNQPIKKTRTNRGALPTIIICVALIAFSIGILAPIYSSPKKWSSEIETLERYAGTAAALSLTTAGASFVLDALPDDWGNSLADEISDLTNGILLITCMIYLEKFFLTVSGYVVFKFLVPIAVAVLGIGIWLRDRRMKVFAVKVLIFALLLLMVVPTGIGLSSLIESTHSQEIHQVIAEANNSTEDVLTGMEETEEEEKGFFQRAGEWISDKTESLINGTQSLIERFKTSLQKLLNAVAVMIITVCVIPILTFLAFGFLMRFFWNVELPTFESMKKSLGEARRGHGKREAFKE